MHQTTNGCGLSEAKKEKILDRANVHQLIILENPPPSTIEKSSLDSSPVKADATPNANFSSTMTSQTTVNGVPAIIKPSSLNYKISLR